MSTPAPKLTAPDSEARLSQLPTGWTIESDTLTKRFQFADFKTALAFVNRLGEAAEAAQHHPDLDIRYNKVTVALTTHDAAGLTAADFEMAAQAEKLFGA